MYQSMTPFKLGFTIILLSIVFSSGCTSTVEIQSPKPTTPAPGVSQSPYYSVNTETYHTVQPGETLLSIATDYGISNYQDLAAWNGLSASYPVSPGTRLRVNAPTGYLPLMTYPAYPYTPITPQSKARGTSQRRVVRSGGNYHTVRKGETLRRIAKAYKRQISELAAWNHLSDPYPLSVGQSLRVTPPTSSKTAKASKSTSSSTTLSTASSSRYHTVNQGDTLNNVAHRYGQNITDIAKWNNLQPPYTLLPNQQLLVKPPGGDEGQMRIASTSSTASKVPDVSVSADETLYHSISSGETLYSISKMYGHSVEQVAAWNGLSPPYNTLKVGQNLRVSSGQKTQKTIASSQGKKTVSKRGKIIQHIVKNKETVYSIAQRYGIKVFDLVTLNGIGEPYTIYTGQKLKIIK